MIQRIQTFISSVILKTLKLNTVFRVFFHEQTALKEGLFDSRLKIKSLRTAFLVDYVVDRFG